MKEKRSVLFFYDLLELVTDLNNNDAGKICKALFEYEMYGIVKYYHIRKLQTIYDIGVRQIDQGRKFFNKKYGDD